MRKRRNDLENAGHASGAASISQIDAITAVSVACASSRWITIALGFIIVLDSRITNTSCSYFFTELSAFSPWFGR
jgi:hypothetical protein